MAAQFPPRDRPDPSKPKDLSARCHPAPTGAAGATCCQTQRPIVPPAITAHLTAAKAWLRSTISRCSMEAQQSVIGVSASYPSCHPRVTLWTRARRPRNAHWERAMRPISSFRSRDPDRGGHALMNGTKACALRRLICWLPEALRPLI